MRAQASIEFLAMSALAISMLALSLLLYASLSESSVKTKGALEAQSICKRVASFIASSATLGDGSEATLTLDKGILKSGKYEIWVVGSHSSVRVEYSLYGEKLGITCKYPYMNVTNSTGASLFLLTSDTLIKNTGGVQVIG